MKKITIFLLMALLSGGIVTDKEKNNVNSNYSFSNIILMSHDNGEL